jgi:hypothetical protein
MVADVANLISSRQAIAVVNEWLASYVGDRFLAGGPALDSSADLWRIPILYVYPQVGPIGDVGEAAVDAMTGELCARPAISEIKRKALQLYQERQCAESAAVPATGD